jgi:NADPH:quinone reductase-like Zn-dependent oxidoreductase
MRAVQITRFGGPEGSWRSSTSPSRPPAPGQTLYDISTAGVNYADTHHPQS